METLPPQPHLSSRGPARPMRKAPPANPRHFAQKPSLPVETMHPSQNVDLVLPDKVVDKIMGPDPVPIIDIEVNEIQNELQKKLVEEVCCVMCSQFPYNPLECRSCHKIFCKYCQDQLYKNASSTFNFDEAYLEKLAKESGEKLETSPTQRQLQMKRLEKNAARGFFTGREMSCPNCHCTGEFFTEVNPVVRNLVDFCEFPHKCNKQVDGGTTWMTVRELQKHAEFDECPKYGCDICYKQEYQHLTRSQLREHIRRDCSDVSIQCQVCSKEFRRGEFAQHQCLKDYYMQKLQANKLEVVEYLAEKMMRYKRQVKMLGLCKKSECFRRFETLDKTKYAAPEGMVAPNGHAQSLKCGMCSGSTASSQEVSCCQYCGEAYCESCLGYNLFFDLQELEDLLK